MFMMILRISREFHTLIDMFAMYVEDNMHYNVYDTVRGMAVINPKLKSLKHQTLNRAPSSAIFFSSHSRFVSRQTHKSLPFDSVFLLDNKEQTELFCNKF